MSRLHLIPLLAFAAALVVGVALLSGCRPPAQGSATVAPSSPAWNLKDLDGREVSSAQFKGKVLVVDFWATWCTPCLGEIPGYIELQKKFGPAGLVIVGIAYRDGKGPAYIKKFAEARGMNYLILMGDDEVAEAFGGIEGLPTTFLIDRQGRIVHHKIGARAHGEYEKLVKQVLN